MIIETTKQLQDFQEKNLGDLTIGSAISTILATTRTDNPALSWQLGKKLATEEKVDLKAEDIVFLKKAITASDTYTPIVVGQLLNILD